VLTGALLLRQLLRNLFHNLRTQVSEHAIDNAAMELASVATIRGRRAAMVFGSLACFAASTESLEADGGPERI